MKIGLIGSGRIGENLGRRWAQAGHQILFSFSRDPTRLQTLADTAGAGARAGTAAEAAAFGDVVVLSVPWPLIDAALDEAGSLDGKIVVDTTNPYTSEGFDPSAPGETSGTRNARRMPGALLVKAFNTLTAGYQAEAKARPNEIAMFYCGDDARAKRDVADLIRAVGFDPVDLGPLANGVIMDAPRRDCAVYGEAFRPDVARQIAAAMLRGDDAAAAALAAEHKA